MTKTKNLLEKQEYISVTEYILGLCTAISSVLHIWGHMCTHTHAHTHSLKRIQQNIWLGRWRHQNLKTDKLRLSNVRDWKEENEESKNLSDLWGMLKHTNIHIFGVPEGQ